MYFVKMSAKLSNVPTLCIERIPLCTNCCTNRCFSSMCLAFLLLPILVAIDFPDVESVWIRVVTFALFHASSKKFLTCNASVPL